jgi:tripeptidyl-peptidase I
VREGFLTRSAIGQYQIPLGTTAAPGNQLGIFESINQHYSQNDFDVFFSTLFP